MRGTARQLRVLFWLLVCAGVFAVPAAAIPISITATASDRGSDPFPRNGVFDSIFGNADVVQILTPPLGDLSGEERGAVEVPLASIPGGSVVLGATLLVSPTFTDIGLGAGEVGEIHGYSGDGAIQVGDLQQINLVGTIAGPTPNGQISIPIDVTFVQSLIDGAVPFAGFMFKGVDGLTPVVFGFEGVSCTAPEKCPTLVVDVQGTPAIPEPTTVLLFGSGLVAIRLRSIVRGRKSNRRAHAAI